MTKGTNGPTVPDKELTPGGKEKLSASKSCLFGCHIVDDHFLKSLVSKKQ